MALNPKNRKLDKNGNPIVTKEELAKSGMSLRDFLNKERGLTRRGAGTGSAVDSNAGESAAKRNMDVDRKRQIAEIAAKSSEGKLNPAVDAAGRAYRSAKENADLSDEFGSSYEMKKGGKVKKYAKGGSVSASRRADGIAQRGKTRGRVL